MRHQSDVPVWAIFLAFLLISAFAVWAQLDTCRSILSSARTAHDSITVRLRCELSDRRHDD